MSGRPEDQGVEGEDAFAAWLDAQGLGYVYIRQDPGRFAALFQSHVKRPDFLVLIDSIGLIAVDVKNKNLSTFGEYTVDYDSELKLVLAFERLLRIPVWYAYWDKQSSWYWISALRAIEAGELRDRKDGKGNFLAIKLEHFAKIQVNQDLGSLYTQRLNSAAVTTRCRELETGVPISPSEPGTGITLHRPSVR